MAEKNVQIKDLQGNLLFPKTNASIVINNAGENLGAVEAGAQVNKIETIKLNGVELQIVNKEVDIVVNGAEYLIEKQEVAENGFSATYFLTKDGTPVGEKINIPKDMVVQSGVVKECEEADAPVAGFKVGDKYIDLLLANTDDEHIYIKVTDLVDIYTAGAGIIIEGQEIAVDTAAVATALADTFAGKEATEQALAGKADAADIPTNVSELTNDAGYLVAGDIEDLAKAADVYTKTQIDEALALKADKADTYTKGEVDTALAGKADAQATTDALALKADTATVNDNLALKANAADVYAKGEVYSKTEIDNKLFITFDELV